MIDPTRLSELDQIMIRVSDTMPTNLKTLFDRLKAAGFGESQAMRLLEVIIASSMAIPNPVEQPPLTTGKGK